ncbi:hypothetical protein [Cellulophaga lytica]|uniref:hypothetical protein n=1 Tax=Cellulophaga lytica TaxID=979 RepID=UPI000B5C3E95|nr:hypothetical protein [Cellulophaga lytica]
METHKATINRQDEKASLILNINEENLEIELTEDKPNEVKNVFNNLIAFLKKGSFQFELEDDKEDLYFHICTEYIGQLNTELSSIYQELEDYELLEEIE